jgi:FKBP-type peptidyl-prolyl cis-trans isomerase
MRKLIPVVLLALLIVGCGKKSEQTQAVKVETPPEAAPPAANAPPSPPAATPAPAAKPGKDGWVALPSGLKYKDKKMGKGAEVTSNNRVSVQYKGWLDNGKVFDTSRKAGAGPFSFTVDNDQVIKGWHEGLKGMKVGGVRELTIPPVLGYGSDDMGAIPPNSTLHFEIELIEIAK